MRDVLYEIKLCSSDYGPGTVDFFAMDVMNFLIPTLYWCPKIVSNLAHLLTEEANIEKATNLLIS